MIFLSADRLNFLFMAQKTHSKGGESRWRLRKHDDKIIFKKPATQINAL